MEIRSFNRGLSAYSASTIRALILRAERDTSNSSWSDEMKSSAKAFAESYEAWFSKHECRKALAESIAELN